MGMLFLPALLLLSGVVCGASAVDPIPTYEHQDPFTRETLHCNKCPSGTHMVAHFTATRQRQCPPCREEHFTKLWNDLPRCLYCGNSCSENQEVEIECSPVSDRVCQCKEGFYSSDDSCIPHLQCEPGSGVQNNGTLEKNTVCEECPDGYFSKSSSALDSCVKHQECSSAELVLLHGTVYQDTVCGSCEAVRLAQAPKEELTNLPEKLKASHLKVKAEKLEKRLSEIKQSSPNCNLSI